MSGNGENLSQILICGLQIFKKSDNLNCMNKLFEINNFACFALFLTNVCMVMVKI